MATIKEILSSLISEDNYEIRKISDLDLQSALDAAIAEFRRRGWDVRCDERRGKAVISYHKTL